MYGFDHAANARPGVSLSSAGRPTSSPWEGTGS
jgi:hypothetical protein